MRNGFFYIALSEKQGKKALENGLKQERTAQLFFEANKINCVMAVTDVHDWLWQNRTGMIQILEYIEKNPKTVDCLIVYEYRNLIWEQSDFNALQRKLISLGIGLISIKRGVIEIESDYYLEL